VALVLNEMVASQIRHYRTAKKMTLADLSRTSEIDDTYLGRVERNEINITLNTLEKIIKGLHMTPAQFFGFLEFESDNPELVKIVDLIQKSPNKEKLTSIAKEIVKLSEP